MKKRYYYVKMDENFLDDVNIRRLRKVAGGAEYVVVYLKMILKTIKTGGVVEVIDGADMVEEMALLLDEPTENVRFVLKFLEKFGLIQIHEMSLVVKYSFENVGSETDSAQRMRDYRDRQKALLQCASLCDEKTSLCDHNVTIYRDRNNEDINKDIEQQQQDNCHNVTQNQTDVVVENEIVKKIQSYGVTITPKIRKALDIKTKDRIETNIEAARKYIESHTAANTAGVVAQAILGDWDIPRTSAPKFRFRGKNKQIDWEKDKELARQFGFIVHG